MWKARTADDVRRAAAAGAVAGLLGIEGGTRSRAARTSSSTSRGGESATWALPLQRQRALLSGLRAGAERHRWTTAFGREVGRAADLGVIVDLAHINKRGFLDACEISASPIVSHTGVLGAFDHWRNIDDEQLRAIAKRGGVAGVIFCPRYLGADGVGPVVAHLRHIIDVCGEDTPALGSDWDGFIIPTQDLKDAARLPLLTDELLKGGFSEEVIAKILRRNALRVLEDNPLPKQ
jgi:membrane dipeptidase